MHPTTRYHLAQYLEDKAKRPAEEAPEREPRGFAKRRLQEQMGSLGDDAETTPARK